MSSADRPARLVVVTGTATEIGKTWVGAAVLAELRGAGHRVAARKPAQSFEPGDDERGITDAQVLAAATGEDPTEVCPPAHWYPVALAPPMAAEVLGRPPLTVETLVGDLRWPAGVDVGMVETAGGVRSPLVSPPAGAEGDDTVTLAHTLAPDAVVVVADAGLGTINAVRLAAEALAPWRDRLVVHLNRFDPADDLHRRNRDWLADLDGLRVTTEVATLAAVLVPARP